jgi:hypothetical protein bfra3_13620|nr:MAG TPA: head to tail adaptor [Caudoviricetes sp.]DAT39269.1 MAG TPA: head to tail adaptor [Caudoviricetes sp.]
MFLTTQELSTHLYQEQISVISRSDETLLTAAIDGAVAEAKSYLGDYDCEHIFSREGADRHPLLLIFIKDMAVWHFICLCNAGTLLEFREKRYNDAKAWLSAVQKGNLSPDLPTKDTNGDGSPDGKAIYLYGSNSKRTQHF